MRYYLQPKVWKFIVARAHEVLEAAGAIEILEGDAISPFAHLMGTARMGSDPKTSVVNS